VIVTSLRFRDIVRQAESTHVHNGLLSVSEALRKGIFLDVTHPYRFAAANSLEGAFTNRTVNKVALEQYLALATLGHLEDAWSYLSQALNAYQRGNAGGSIHLAYYAEVRAAKSMLATQGLLVVNSAVYWFDRRGRCNTRLFKLGSHQVLWETLKAWASTPAASNSLFDSIRVHGMTIKDWLNAFPILSSSTWSPIASQLLSQWGLDIELMARDDRNARNVLSYEPTRFSMLGNPSTLESVRFLCSVWAQLEPQGSSTLGDLDAHILRLSINEALSTTLSHNDETDRRITIRKLLAGMGRMSPTMQSSWFRFICDSNDPPLLFDYAEKSPDTRSPKSALSVLSRALLLSRSATALCSEQISGSGLDSRDLRPWANEIGISRGFWQDADAMPNDLVDLWDDVELALVKCEDWTAQRISHHSYSDMARALGGSVDTLSGSERVMLWGLDL
jgi:hypothetical protein